jgi:hypothetical protein
MSSTTQDMTIRKAKLLQELRVKCLQFEAAMQLVTHPDAEKESVEVHNARIHKAYSEMAAWLDEIRRLDANDGEEVPQSSNMLN